MRRRWQMREMGFESQGLCTGGEKSSKSGNDKGAADDTEDLLGPELLTKSTLPGCTLLNLKETKIGEGQKAKMKK